jgi:hypothetical protein
MATIIVGVVIFLVGQYALVLVLQPIGRVRRILADISSTILFQQALITNGRVDNELARELKRMGALLRAASAEVIFYRFWAFLRIFSVPSEKRILKGSHQLNLLFHNLSETRDANGDAQWAEKNTLILEELRVELGIHTTFAK